MNKRQFIIKPTEHGYSICLRKYSNHPLQTFPDKKSAKKRLNQYFKNIKEN